MTTIVASLECMAADARVTGEGPIAHVQKIHRIKGSLFGLAGEVALGFILLKWLSGPRDIELLHKLIPADHRDDIGALELAKDGLAYWSGWGARIPLLDTTYAIGSGAQAALTLVKKGESLDMAIKSACNLDECSGVFLTPQVEWLKPKKGT